MPVAFPGPASSARLAGRIAAAAFTAFIAVGLVTRLNDDPARLAAGASVAVAAVVPLFLLRLRPVLAWAALATTGVALLGNADSRAIVWFALVVVLSWCVVVGGVQVGAVYWAAAVLLLGGEWLWAVRDPGWAPWIAGVTVSALAALLVRHELVLVERLRAAQAELAEQTRTEERARIARDLHDVIAHSLTVSLLHVTGARLAVEHDPADAARALAEAERLGRQALTEIRATMGVLRAGDPVGSPPPPVPGADQVPELVEQFRRAGVTICPAIQGDLAALPETVGSTLYRILQEALTNATKHAPGAAVTVEVAATNGHVDLRVDSAGTPQHGTGMGLTNMAERARALGGTCTAGPGGQGWLVAARLPRWGQESPSR